MIEWLIAKDKLVFLWINGFHHPFFDNWMVWISGNVFWIPFYVFIIWLLWKKYAWKVILLLLVLALLVLLSDQGSVQLFKNAFQRLRPCHDPSLDGLVHIVNGKCGGRFGFVSSHAANVFAVAFFLMLLFRRYWISVALVCWAGLISYSRIYLGVHFPGDVVCGAVFGMGTGVLVFYFWLFVDNIVFPGIKKQRNETEKELL